MCARKSQTWHFWGCDVVTSSHWTEQLLSTWPCQLTPRHPWHCGWGFRCCAFGLQRKADYVCVCSMCWRTTGVWSQCQGVKRSSERAPRLSASRRNRKEEKLARVTNTYPEGCWGSSGQAGACVDNNPSYFNWKHTHTHSLTDFTINPGESSAIWSLIGVKAEGIPFYTHITGALFLGSKVKRKEKHTLCVVLWFGLTLTIQSACIDHECPTKSSNSSFLFLSNSVIEIQVQFNFKFSLFLKQTNKKPTKTSLSVKVTRLEWMLVRCTGAGLGMIISFKRRGRRHAEGGRGKLEQLLINMSALSCVFF